MSPELGDRTNHCRRLLARWCVFEFGGKHFSPTERIIGTRTGSGTTTPEPNQKSLPIRQRELKDKYTTNEQNKQFDPGGKGEEIPPWKAGVPVFYSFSGGNSGPGCPLLVSRALLLVCFLCTVLIR